MKVCARVLAQIYPSYSYTIKPISLLRLPYSEALANCTVPVASAPAHQDTINIHPTGVESAVPT